MLSVKTVTRIKRRKDRANSYFCAAVTMNSTR
jgi:hypothetical protein